MFNMETDKLIDKPKIKPRTVEDAAALISTSKEFQGKAQNLVRINLGSFLNGTDEYKDIAEDATSTAVENLLKIIKRKGKAWPLYDQALKTYGSDDDCLTTKYLYKSVRRYMTNRQYYWGTDKDSKVPRYKARAHQERSGDGSASQSHEEWLDMLVEGQSNKLAPLHERLDEIIEMLRLSEVSSELVEIVKMRGEGNSYVEIAAHFGVSADSIRMKLNRAKKTLSETLDIALGSS
jgi:DNA-directed RNA polymerase specialized sigma24 family protein